jgi:hypothetical protein
MPVQATRARYPLPSAPTAWGALATGIVLVAHVLILTVTGDQGTRAMVSDLLLPLEGAAAAAVLLLAARRLRAEPRQLIGWLLVGLSWLCTAVRDGGWWISEIFFREPLFPSTIDLVNLLGYPLFLLGVLFLSPLQRLFRERARLLVDIAIVLIATALILSIFAFLPLQQNGIGNPPAHNALALIYPAGDFLEIAAAVILLYCPRRAAFAGSAWLLIASAIVRVSTDFTFGSLNLNGTYRSGSLFEIGWAVSAALSALAALRWMDPHLRSRSTDAPTAEDEATRRLGPLWLSHLPYLWITGTFALVA